MISDSMQLRIARMNIRKLIIRINLLEDRIERIDCIKTLRPEYVIDSAFEDNGLPIA